MHANTKIEVTCQKPAPESAEARWLEAVRAAEAARWAADEVVERASALSGLLSELIYIPNQGQSFVELRRLMEAADALNGAMVSAARAAEALVKRDAKVR
jgi:hypothetical protein